jgi:hypothetical protein
MRILLPAPTHTPNRAARYPGRGAGLGVVSGVRLNGHRAVARDVSAARVLRKAHRPRRREARAAAFMLYSVGVSGAAFPRLATRLTLPPDGRERDVLFDGSGLRATSPGPARELRSHWPHPLGPGCLIPAGLA